MIAVASWRKVFTVWTTCFVLGGCGAAMPRRTGPIVKNDHRFMGEYLDWMVAKEARKADVPGVVVAVVDGSQIVWETSYGWADASRRVPATPDTLFRVGSVSKLLTATEIMRRIDEGEMELDGEIGRELSGFSIHSRFVGAQPITVRSLLSHHSGLPRDYMNRGAWTRASDLAKLVHDLAEDSLVAPPQTEFRYSNLDFMLLGRMIELESHGTFSAVIQRELLDPLGMVHSSFDPGALDSKGYSSGKELPVFDMHNVPSGSLVSSANDLARFIEFVLAEGHASDGRGILRPETLRSMFTPQLEALPLDFGYRMGLGWMLMGLDVPGAGTVAWHDGSVPGYYASMAVAPDAKLGVVVLANDGAASAFADRVSKKALALELETKLGSPEKQEPHPNDFRTIEMPKQVLDQYVGDYVVMDQLTHLGRDGDHLEVDAFGRHFALLPIGKDRFVPEASSLLGLVHEQLPAFTVAFATVQDRRFAVVDGLGKPMAFERYVRRPLPQAWARRLGECRPESGNPMLRFDHVSLEFEDGLLLWDIRTSSEVFGVHDQRARTLLDPIDDRTAIVAGKDQHGVVRVLGGPGREKLFFSGYTFTCHPAS